MSPFDDPEIDVPMLGEASVKAFLGTLSANLQRTLRTGHQMEPGELSPAEFKLAAALHEAGIEFSQQHQIGPYWADFWFESASLVVEVDGAAYHTDDVREKRRNEYMLQHGAARVFHFRALEVFARVHECVRKIEGEIDHRPPNLGDGLPRRSGGSE